MGIGVPTRRTGLAIGAALTGDADYARPRLGRGHAASDIAAGVVVQRCAAQCSLWRPPDGNEPHKATLVMVRYLFPGGRCGTTISQIVDSEITGKSGGCVI